jgi:predicted DNA-binding protein YlxM (UPF0122 family)
MNRQKRKAEMERMRFEELMTLQEIGDEFDLSKERVRQIIGNTGYIISKSRNKQIAKSTKTNTELAEKYGLSPGYISQLRDCHHDVDGGTVEKAVNAERYVSKELNKHNIPNKLMQNRSPFDILALDNVKIDVKSAFSKTKTNSNMKSPQWKFCVHTDRRGKCCDLFVCVIWDTKDCFIIPFDEVGLNRDAITFCYPTKRPDIGKYQKYHNRWDLIVKTADKIAAALGVTLNELLVESEE